MSFLQPTDHLIIMDLWYEPRTNARCLTPPELQQLRTTGAGVILNFVNWRKIETAAGVYDWSFYDQLVEAYRTAGFRTLLMVYDEAPEWFPPDWYLTFQDGTIAKRVEGAGACGWSMLSPWNEEAQSVARTFINLCRFHYDAPDVQCIAGFGKEGESLLIPGAHAWFDPAAKASWRLWCLQHDFKGQETDLASPALLPPVKEWLTASMVAYALNHHSLYREPWTCLHRAFPEDAGCFNDAIYTALNQPLWGIQWTYMSFKDVEIGKRTRRDKDTYQIKMWGGAEWVEGLRPHTPIAIAHGLQGLIVGPIHPYSGHDKIEDWMLEAMTWSLAQWPQGAS